VRQSMENLDSALATGPKPQFSSRFADPSHAANSGSLIALISGGVIQLPDRDSMLGNCGSYGHLGRMGGRAIPGRGVGGATVRGEAQSDTVSGRQRGLEGLRGDRGGGSAGPLGLVQKVMKKVRLIPTYSYALQLTKTQDVLYLVIVDMPSEDELAAAQGIATELMDGEERN
jgi:hypothetical protein